MPPNTSSPIVIQRGREAFEASYQAMREFTDARDAATPDQLWLVEHPPVFTLGLGADRAHVLDAHGIPVVQTDRGGEVTYHGPGQAVAYLLLDLRRKRSDARLFVREFVTRIEAAAIDTLAAYGVAGTRRAGAPGIYLADGAWQGAKIAALGLRIRGNGCTYHGLALNVAMDLAPFSWINPCGYRGLATVDLRTLGVAAELGQVQQVLARALTERLAA